MAARIRKVQLTDEWRAKIQATAICARLQGHIDGKIELSQTQLAAAKILLAKVIPDLARSELTGKDGKELTLVVSATDLGVL